MKTLTAEYNEETGEYWVTTRLNGKYIGGGYRSAEDVADLGFDAENPEKQEIRI